MRRGWKIGLAVAGGVFAAGLALGGWIADRTILAQRAWGHGLNAAQAGDHAAAEERLSAAIRKLPTDAKLRPSAYRSRARSRIELGKYDDAIADANEALRLDPSQRQAWTWRGIAFYKLGRYEEAERDLNASLAEESKSVPAQYYRGLIAERKGRLNEAEVHYRAAIDHNSAFARGFAALSRVRRAQGDDVWADMFAQSARERKPDVSFEIE